MRTLDLSLRLQPGAKRERAAEKTRLELLNLNRQTRHAVV